MKTNRAFLILALLAAGNLAAQERPAHPSSQSLRPAASGTSAAESLEKKVEAYLRKLYAWGPQFHLKVGPLKPAPVPDFYEVPVEVTMGGQSDSALVYVSKDGRYLLRGDMQDMNADPLAALRAQIPLAGAPSKGPANAKVVVVEFSDFQCPTCRQLHQVLRDLLPKYPQVRLVYKDFPLTQIHPWAMTAALAGRCAYEQDHAAFWKLYDAIFDNQDLISAADVWPKMLDFAGQAGLDVGNLRVCMASKDASDRILADVKEGQKLKIANTPTIFVNGRRMIGADPSLLEQYIQYELTAGPDAPTSRNH